MQHAAMVSALTPGFVLRVEGASSRVPAHLLSGLLEDSPICKEVLLLKSKGQSSAPKWGKKMKLSRALGFIALPVLLAACGSGGAETSTVPASPVEATTAVAATPSPMASTVSDTVLSFGETYTSEMGSQVTISAPRPFEPTPTAAGVEGPSVLVDITVLNGTSEPLDLFGATSAAVLGETPCSKVFDSANGVGEPPATQLLPGKTVTYQEAYSCPSAASGAELQMDYSPTLFGPDLFFLGPWP